MLKDDTCVVFGIPWAAGRFCRQLATGHPRVTPIGAARFVHFAAASGLNLS